jgi:hypothetical protein
MRPEIVALTVAEIRRLLNAFVLAVALPPAHPALVNLATIIPSPSPTIPLPAQTGQVTLEYHHR